MSKKSLPFLLYSNGFKRFWTRLKARKILNKNNITFVGQFLKIYLFKNAFLICQTINMFEPKGVPFKNIEKILLKK